MKSPWQTDLEYMAALPTLDSLAPAQAGNSWYAPQTPWRGQGGSSGPPQSMPTIPQMAAPQPANATRVLYGGPMQTNLSAFQAPPSHGGWNPNGPMQTNPQLFQQAIHDVSQLATVQALGSKTGVGSKNSLPGPEPLPSADKANLNSSGEKKKKKKACC